MNVRAREEGQGVVMQVQQDEDVAEGMRALHRQMVAEVGALVEAARERGAAGRLQLVAGPAANDPGVTLAAADARTEKVTYLGVATNRVSGVLRQQLKLAKGVGLVVEFVEKGSPAEAAGLQVHDIVEKFEDQWVVNQEQFTVLVRMKQAGEEASMTVVRGGERVVVKVKLGEKEVPVSVEMDPAMGGGIRPGGFLPEGFELQPGSAAPGWNFQRSSTRVAGDGSVVKRLVDDQNEVEIARGKEGPATVVVKDKRGQEVYRGAYETAEDKAKVPAGLAEKVKRLDEGVAMSGGAVAAGSGKVVGKGAVLTRTDEEHVIGLRVDNGAKVLTVRDAKTGAVLFDGPVNTEEERRGVPAGVMEKLKAMEEKVGG